MSIESDMLNTLFNEDFEEAGLEYVDPEGVRGQSVYQQRGIQSGKSFASWVDKELTRLVRKTNLAEGEINIYVMVGVSDDEMWYYSVPSSFILPGLVKRKRR